MQGWTNAHIGITFFTFLIIALNHRVGVSFCKEKAKKPFPQEGNRPRKRGKNEQKAERFLPVGTGEGIKKKIRQKRFSIVKATRRRYEV